MMVKKLLLGVLTFIVVVGVGCGFYWLLNSERLKTEYAAYRKTGAPVLMYHGVDAKLPKGWPRSLIMPTAKFEEQIRYLSEQGYKIVTVEELAHRLEKGESVNKYVALSFDDGYKDNYTTVLPLLQKYNAKGTFSIIPRMIGKEIYMNDEEILRIYCCAFF